VGAASALASRTWSSRGVGKSPRQAGDAGCARYPGDQRRQRGADPRPDLGQGGRHHSCADSKSIEKGFAYRFNVVIQ
jgi:hypothetical protein